VPLTLEGPPRTMRGVPALAVTTSTAIGAPGACRTARPGPRGRGHRGRVAEGTGRLRGAGQPTGGSAAPGGLPPIGRGILPPRSRRVPLLPPASFRQLTPLRQLAIPFDDFRVPACDLGVGHGPARRALARP
jgi:hypothetical protein